MDAWFRCISEAVVVVSTFRNTGGVALPIVRYKAVSRHVTPRQIVNRHSLIAVRETVRRYALCQVSAAMWMRSALFCDVTHCREVI